MPPQRLAYAVAYMSTTAGVWLILMALIWWPIVALLPGPQSPGGPYVGAPELPIMLPLAFVIGAFTVAERWLKSGRWRRLRLLVAVAGMTGLLWLGLVIAFTLYKRLSGSLVDAPELLLMLGGLAFLCAVPLVAWAERNLTVTPDHTEQLGRTTP